MSKYLYSVLTVNTGGYEPIREVSKPNKDVEYVCVTDNPDLKSKTWKLIYIPDIWFLYVKHHPYEFISSDVCLWLDGSYQLIDDPTDAFVKPFIESNKELSISLHDKRWNVVEEAMMWVYIRNFSFPNAERFIIKILAEQYRQATLFQTSCILSKKTADVLNIFYLVSELEHELSAEGKYRDDQTLVSYIIGKHYYRWDKINLMNFEKIANNPYFVWKRHGSDDQIIVQQKSFRCFDLDFEHLYEIGDDFNTDWTEYVKK